MLCTGDCCPVCGEPYGRAELVGTGRDRIRYWHADLVEVSEFCLSFADGSEETQKRCRKAVASD